MVLTDEWGIPIEELKKFLNRYDYFLEIDNADIKVLITVEEAVVNKGKRIRFKFYTGAEIEVALD